VLSSPYQAFSFCLLISI